MISKVHLGSYLEDQGTIVGSFYNFSSETFVKDQVSRVATKVASPIKTPLERSSMWIVTGLGGLSNQSSDTIHDTHCPSVRGNLPNLN